MEAIKRLVKCISYIEKLDIKEIKDLNIGVEIQDFTEPNLNENEIKILISKYKKAFKNFQGIKSLHGPFLDLKPSSPDLLIRKVSYRRYLKTMKIAAELDMDYIIFHSQINPYLNEPSLIRLNNSQSKEFWDKLLKEANYEGTILIENIFEETPKMLKEYIKAIDRSNIKVNLDIGHARLGKVDLEEWILELGEYIEYMHLHSNDGAHDKHNELSKEEVDNLYYLLKKYKLNPVLSLEYDVENLSLEMNKYI